MPDESLMLLASEVRGKTLRLLDGVSESEARFTPVGLNNTILWHAGHALVVVEHLSVAPATGGPPSYPHGWFETFSWKSVPATVARWPTLDEVVERLRDQLMYRSVRLFGSMPASRSDGSSILHGLHDEAGHQGEIYLLRKMVRVGLPKPRP